MTLIDQRILIDAPAPVVWEFLSDPERQAAWHVGYSGISILTTQRTGQGVRRRCTLAGQGKDVIEEITAWVDGLGYEYRLIEGGPYGTFQGRFRLQPVPDGTTVQWTVSYKTKGVAGWLKDRTSGRNTLMAMMADSLRRLRRQVDELGVRADQDYRARVGIRARLNADERAQYQRRHAPPPGVDVYGSAEQSGVPVTLDEPASQPAETAVTEPPAPPSMPTPSVPTPTFSPPPDPAFVASLAHNAETSAPPEEDSTHTADTEPKPPAGLHEIVAEQHREPDQPAALAVTPDSPSPSAPPVQGAIPEPPPPPAISPPPVRLPTPPEPQQPVPPAEEETPDYNRPTPPRGIPSVQRPAAPEQPREMPPAPPAAPRRASPARI